MKYREVTKEVTEDAQMAGGSEKTKPVNPPTVKYFRESSHPDGQCGCGARWAPTWLQCLRNPLIIVCFMCLVGIATLVNNAYFGATLSTIERRFGLSNSQSAFFASVNDLSKTLVVVFISFIAERTSRPLWLLFALLCLAVGNLMTALPHFLSAPLNTEALLDGRRSTSGSLANASSSSHLCTIDVESDSTSTSSDTCMEESVGFRGLIWWAICGQIVVGIGQASFSPVVIPYLDDLAGRDRRKFVVYNTIYSTVFIGGPALGYFLGSSVLQFYVDFERIPKEDIPTGISQRDPRWIGAWWIGFVAIGLYMLVAAIPMSFLPRDPSVNVCTLHAHQMDHNRNGVKNGNGTVEMYELLDKKEQSTKTHMGRKDNFLANARAFLPVVKRILGRPVLVFVIIFMTLEIACISVFTSFTVKYFLFHFGISPRRAAFLNGAVMVPAAVLGINVSGFVCRRFKLTLKQCGKYLMLNSMLTVMLLVIAMFIGCENPPVAGVTESYNTGLDNVACNANCECEENIFRPVCGSDGVSYLSPCHSGCVTKEISNSSMSSMYTSCTCINPSPNDGDYSSAFVEDEEFGSAYSGLCPREESCGTKLIYLVLVFGGLAFCRVQDNTPLSLVLLGNSEKEIRTTVYGLGAVIYSILGYFPTPIYFGAIVNRTCSLWQYACGERGACWLYDIDKLRYAYFGINIAIRLIQIVVCLGIVLTVKESLNKESDEGKTKQAENKPVRV